MLASHAIRRCAPLLGAGAVALAVAACGGATTSTSSTASTRSIPSARSTSSTDAGASAIHVAPETAHERRWLAAAQGLRNPPTPRGWEVSDAGEVYFANFASGGNEGIPLGESKALFEVRCSSSTVVTPSISYTPSLSSAIDRTATLPPFTCTSVRSRSDSYLLEDNDTIIIPGRWEGSEVVHHVGRYDGGAIAFHLSRPAAVEIGYYEPAGEKMTN